MNTIVLWLALSVAVLAYMTLWFGAAQRYKRYDLVDSAWGLGFAYVAWLAFAITHASGGLKLLVALLVSLWGARLCIHISRRNWGKPEDRRYTTMRAKWGRHKSLNTFLRVFLVQGALLLLISTPVVGIMMADRPANLVSWFGIAIWIFGICFEAAADYQLAQFLKQRAKGSHQIMQSGLWHVSRHPNYFGEIAVWWGAAVVAIGAGQGWGIIGALTITLLITKISGVPPLEKHYADNPNYEKYRQNTSILVPLPPKR